ncbi:unnamed protein product [Clavelina lepadiformis]|uniref:Arf-GAP with Rho-GAP domain, ANK repeat and PH domain-containing protein 1 n=1 Tax=Clavelina lepadiformis TaxID=159417 RepID=A0ABP0G0B9_CLALP
MALNDSENESIQNFLEKLKLADKYSDLFVSNGYLTVNDCNGITEETLKDIGVTLPGHYRRILSKLPGCKVKKPPRPNRSTSLEPNLSPDIEKNLFNVNMPLNDDAFEVKEMSESPAESGDTLANLQVQVDCEDIYMVALSVSSKNDETSVTATNGPPKKPPRSPENVRKSVPVQIDVELFPELPPPSPVDNFSNSLPLHNTVPPLNISQAVSQFLAESPKSRSPVADCQASNLPYSNKQSRDQQNEVGLTLTDFVGISSLVTNTEGLGSGSKIQDMPLPSPPKSTSSSPGDVTFPSPPPEASSSFWEESLLHQNSSSNYDHLSITKAGTDNFQGRVSVETAADSHELDSYLKLTITHPSSGLTTPTDLKSTPSFPFAAPARSLPQYEEITLPAQSSHSTSAENTAPTSPVVSVEGATNQESDHGLGWVASTEGQSPTYESANNIAEMTKLYQQSGLGDYAQTTDANVARSKSFDVYDALSTDRGTASSSENVYNMCDDDVENVTLKKAMPTSRPLKSSTLPRSSGSLPACSINPKVKRINVVRHRSPGHDASPRRHTESSVAEADVSATSANFIQKEEKDSIYQTIDQESLPAKIDLPDVRLLRANTGALLNASKIRSRLGPKRSRGVLQGRPLSAMVEGFRGTHLRQSSSEESLDRDDNDILSRARNSHKRTSSSSDAMSSVDLIDAQLAEDGSPSRYSELSQLASPSIRKKKTKKGWLNKHGGHETLWRKRWVVFDGEELIYYESDTKTELSKGIIPVDVILRVQVSNSDPKIFHIMAKGGRKYIFTAENSDEKAIWTSTILAAKLHYEKQSQNQFKPGGCMYMPYKEGFLKMDGSRQKNYLATKGDLFAYYKTSNEFNFGQPVAKLSMKIATVKEVDKKKFQVIFPFRTFTLTADSEEEKRSWVEALNDAIAEGLSDYKVVEEVWMNEPNKKCADCGREDPDWASINLAVVICKHCAGVHRDLGVHNSKVRSLKMDVKIWNENMKNLLFTLGNGVANSFWGARLKSSDAITDMADKKQRAWYITSKYLEMQYLEPHKFCGNQARLNQALINAVRNNDLREAYALVFSGADPNCDTGKAHPQTPFLLAKYLNYDIMAEFLYQNGATEDVSPEGHVTDRSACIQKKNSLPKGKAKPPVMLKDYLYKYGGDFKSSQDDTKSSRGLGLIRSALQQGEFQKRMCVLENNYFKYYDPERTSLLKDGVDCAELISIGICQPEQATKAGFQHCFEVGRKTGRTYLFCADRKEIASKWTRGLMQAIVPPHVQNAMKNDTDYDRIGKMWIKSQHWAKKSSEWSTTWCRLKKKKLQYFHLDSMTMETIDLRRLVQLGLDRTQEGNPADNKKEPVPTFMLVFRDKSYYLRSDTKADSESWLAAVKKADCECGYNLSDQQLTAEGVPIILEKCTTYVEQFGLTTKGIYRLSGTHSKTTKLLSDFKQNARETVMRDTDLNVHDVANALKRWFKSLPGSLLTEELHEEWIDTSQIKQEHRSRKLEWYKHLIEKLPEINRNTLKVLLIHLNNVASHEKENEMSLHNLAIVFGPTLMEPQGSEDSKQYIGETAQEIGCIEDLLNYYDWLFDVTEVDLEKERRMLEAKEKISQATQQQNMLTTLDYDMMVPIYINSKDDKCVNYKVNMTAGELVARICSTHGYPSSSWGLFEVISDGDAERSLHHTEHVLSVIKAWEMPSTNFLLAKHDYVRDKLRWLKAPTFTEHLFEGQLKVYDAKKKWIKMAAILKETDGALSICYSKAKGATIVSLSCYHVYIGLDRKTKPPSSRTLGFTLAARDQPTKYFSVDNEKNLYKWIAYTLMHKHPEGFTPPPSPAFSPDPVPTFTRSSDSRSTKRSAYPAFSHQDLGEAVKAAAISRMSSTSSDEAAKESPYDTATAGAPGHNEESPDAQQNANSLVPSGGRPISFNPSALGDNLISKRPLTSFATSPNDPSPRGGFLGVKLQSELSSVLRKRTDGGN